MMALWMLPVALLLMFSQEAMEAGRQAAQVFASAVMPALFPMMVLGSLMGNARKEKSGGVSQWVFLTMFGFCAGSPASARQVAAAHQRHAMSAWQRSALLCMSGVMSPMFFTGTLAGQVGKPAGWLMLLCHWLSALLTGAVCILAHRLGERNRPKGSLASAQMSSSPQYPPSAGLQKPAGEGQAGEASHGLTGAITTAARSLLSVLGAMMLFAVAAALIRTLVIRLLPTWAASHQPALAVMWAALEISGGAFAILDCFSSPPIWLLCGLCSFGGLSIWLQNLLFLDKMIRPAALLGWRMLHGALGALLCYGMTRWTESLWGVEQLAGAADAMAVAGQGSTGATGAALWLSLGLLIILGAHPRQARRSF